MQTPFLPLLVLCSTCITPVGGVGAQGAQGALWRQQLPSTGPVCPVPAQCPAGQTTAALGQLNCLVKYKWAGDFLKLEECGKPLGRG